MRGTYNGIIAGWRIAQRRRLQIISVTSQVAGPWRVCPYRRTLRSWPKDLVTQEDYCEIEGGLGGCPGRHVANLNGLEGMLRIR